MNNPGPQGYGQSQYGAPQQGYAPPGYANQQPGQPIYYPPPKKKPWLLITLLVVGIPVLIVIGIVGLGALYLATSEESTPSAAELRAVLTVDDLAPYIEGFTASKGAESATKIKFIDGSYDIDYEYEDDELFLNAESRRRRFLHRMSARRSAVHSPTRTSSWPNTTISMNGATSQSS